MPADDERTDGRTARRDRNRDAVLDAALDLFREDAMFPGPAEVAERSGVSTRSVQRYFEDMDTLVRAAMSRHLEKVGPLFLVADPGVGPLDERVERLVSARVTLYESVGPMVRAAMLRVRSNDLIRQRLADGRATLRDQVEAMFAPELDALDAERRRDLLDAVDGMLSFESLELLCMVHGRTEAETRRILERAVGALLRPA